MLAVRIAGSALERSAHLLPTGQAAAMRPGDTLVQPSPDDRPDSTANLIFRAQAGDERSRDRLAARYLPILRRLAHGRLPRLAQGPIDTDDLVQNTLIRAFNRLEGFEPRREGAFMAYLRQILMNLLRDEGRRVARSPGQEALGEEITDGRGTPLEEAIGSDTLEAYERGLARLPEDQREAVVLRIEIGLPYQQLAEAIGSPSANATRTTVVRALARLAEYMKEHR